MRKNERSPFSSCSRNLCVIHRFLKRSFNAILNRQLFPNQVDSVTPVTRAVTRWQFFLSQKNFVYSGFVDFLSKPNRNSFKSCCGNYGKKYRIKKLFPKKRTSVWLKVLSTESLCRWRLFGPFKRGYTAWYKKEDLNCFQTFSIASLLKCNAYNGTRFYGKRYTRNSLRL